MNSLPRPPDAVTLPHIVAQPRAVLHYLAPKSGVLDAAFTREAQRRLRRYAANPSLAFGHDAGLLEIFPEWVAIAGPGIFRHPDALRIMKGNPLLASRMLEQFYPVAHGDLEAVVQTSGEASVSLLLAVEQGRIGQCVPRERYEQALLAEPFWGMCYLTSPAVPAAICLRASFAQRLRDSCKERRRSSAQAALVHLCLNPCLSPKPYARILCKDPLAAYCASRMLTSRGLLLDIEQVERLDARWATHIALWGHFPGGNAAHTLEDAIVTHPGWLGEYIAGIEGRSDDWDWFKHLYNRAGESRVARGTARPCWWADLLWGMLDRICRDISGENPRVTFNHSIARAGLSGPDWPNGDFWPKGE